MAGIISWKTAKVVVIAGATVAVIGYFAGTNETVTITHTAVAGTAWGVGVGAGAVKEVGPAFQSGFRASDGVDGSYSGAPAPKAPTAADSPPPAASPQSEQKAIDKAIAKALANNGGKQ